MLTRRLATCALGAALFLAAALPAESAGAEGAPSCAEGPATVGEAIVGTPCADTIVAPPGVELVRGGGGDDTIVPAPIAASAPCPDACHLGVGSQTFEGGPGDDVVYGERGNDRLDGGEGNDQLFGGIGDDLLQGGPGNDRLLGGFGADSIDGEAGDDYVRGDATIDTILDSGGGNDTLSLSTGVTPGFPNNQAYPDFSAVPNLPGPGGERGAYVDLGGTVADDGVAPLGGGVDTIEGGAFETLIGTPFSDYLVGGSKDETIYGGGGGDVIRGEGGDDTLYGGADGDDLDGGSGTNVLDGGSGSDHCASPTSGTGCESSVNKGGVVLRDAGKISVGLMAPEDPRFAQLYLSGSTGDDAITASYAAGSPASVTFSLASAAPFDASSSASAGCNPASPSQVVCPLGKPLDSLALAGLGGNDAVQVSGFPETASIVIAGGEGSDTLTGTESEDVLVDGPDAGADTLNGLGGDDALLNNGGADQLFAGAGNDLFLSDSICDGDLLDGGGGAERDNASWAKFKSSVEARIGEGDAGRPGAGGAPSCPSGSLDSLQGIEDLEGTSSGDVFYGGPGSNQLLGWAGSDAYFSGAGDDTILANSGDFDSAIECGEGADTALIDRPPIHEVAAPDCERVLEADPNSFRVETQLSPPTPEPPATTAPTPQPQGGKAKPPRGGRSKSPPGSAAQHTCLPRLGSRHLSCAQRPRRIAVGALGLVNRLRWRHWGSRRSIAFGHLTVSGGCCSPGVSAPAKVRASRLRECNSRRWYTRLKVTYGRGYRRTYVRGAPSSTPCV
jgi:Ca2+-binding RTX toxin-like protein